MSKSGRLRASDVHSLFELVGECRHLGDDCVAWRWHFMAGLADLIGADMALKGEMAGCLAGRNIDLGVVFWMPEGCTPPAYWPQHLAQFQANPGYSPALTMYHRWTKADPGLALSRAEFIPDRDWYGSHDFLKINEPLGVDSILWCFRPIAAASDESTGLILARDRGRRDFSARALAMAREAHAAISPLVGGPLARFADPSPMGLAPRVRQVLACLLEGEGDKQIAARLGLGVHTVNQHSKAIFRHFGVRSRSELLARWIRRGWGGNFPWVK